MKKYLPVGISEFKDIISLGFVYVDKTKWIHKLVSIPKGVYFLSRPRRFGKSLTVSTLDALFSGERELFKGTYIYNHWPFKDDEKFLVLKLNMRNMNIDSVENMKTSLKTKVKGIAQRYDIKLINHFYDDSFCELISKLGEKCGNNLVILIDEYDYPILEHLTQPDVYEIREVLSNFYACLKDNEEHIRFLFITGISKFSKVSIFSKLNHLNDLTLSREFADFLGYSKDEIAKFYRDYIEEVKKELNLTEEQFWQKLEEWYNGYSWDGKTKVYNPYSITKFFSEKQFQNYWFETGTPTFLIEIINKKGVNEIKNKAVTDNDLNISITEIEQVNLASFLWQSGYYTIKKIENIADTYYYTLDFPNKEVRKSFSESLVKYFVKPLELIERTKVSLVTSFISENWQEFINEINRLLGSITYHQYKDLNDYQKEAFWHVIVQMILSATFPIVESEPSLTHGRPDLVVKYKGKTLVMEIKINRSAKEAIEQVKKYADAYKDAVLMGININTEKKQITEWIVK